MRKMPVCTITQSFLQSTLFQANLLKIKPQILYLQSLSTALGVSPSFLTFSFPEKASVPGQGQEQVVMDLWRPWQPGAPRLWG